MKKIITGMNEENTDKNENILVVTQEIYDRMKAKGIDDETLLKPGTYKFRRTKRVATKEELHPSNTKVEFMMKLDLDVLEYFEERAGQSDAESFQTQINKELRAAMERDRAAKDEDVETRLLKNKEFISALAEELKKVA